jgi:putative glutamine amidotransferase
MDHARTSVLLFEGGGDISPALYGQKLTHAHAIASERDTRETFLYTAARRLGIPILGICRGHQLVAALEGGTLYQDIWQDAGVNHGGGHLVRFDAGTPFAEIMQSNPRGKPVETEAGLQCMVNSRVVGMSHDGLIEAIMYPFGLTVQWHPELMGHDDLPEWVFRSVKQGDLEHACGT